MIIEGWSPAHPKRVIAVLAGVTTGGTVIGAGTRLDNFVHIGHNVRIGRCCVVVAQVGIAGSTVHEDFVQVGGQAALAEHLHVGQAAKIGAQSGVMSDVPAGEVFLGTPAQQRRSFFKQVADPEAHCEWSPRATMNSLGAMQTKRIDR